LEGENENIKTLGDENLTFSRACDHIPVHTMVLTKVNDLKAIHTNITNSLCFCDWIGQLNLIKQFVKFGVQNPQNLSAPSIESEESDYILLFPIVDNHLWQ
jgi:hypothetical protein